MRESIDAHSPRHLPRSWSYSSSSNSTLQGLGQADLGSAEGRYSATSGDLEVDRGGVTGLLVPLFGWRCVGKG